MTTLAARCDCCVGVADRTPLEVANRPGLSAIAYRTGTHGDFLASMVAGLTDASRPGLARLSTRDDDDLSVALLDAFAVVGDVLSFYTERLANEAYLRTATERVSVQELARLIGYRVRPGVAAETHLAFAVEAPPAMAPGTGIEPGSAPPVLPGSVEVASGLRVMSIPGPGEKPQTFETVEAVDARAAWNAIRASTTKPVSVQRDDVDVWLHGAALNLKVGDVLLLIGADVLGERWDVRTLAAVESKPELDRTRVVFDSALGSRFPRKDPANRPDVYVLRKRLDVFGHNAPAPAAVLAEIVSAATGGWPGPISAASGTAVDVVGAHPDVVAGSWVVLTKPGFYREAWRVAFVEELSRADFGVSGRVTRLHLRDGENYELFRNATRTTTVLAAAEPLELADPPDDSLVSGSVIAVDGDVSELPKARAVIVRGTTAAGTPHAEVARVDHVADSAGSWQLVLTSPLSAAYERGSVVVHANVARATHGETKTELLGSGSARLSFQRFSLAHAPLTQLRSTADPSGVEAALEVRVNDVRWTETRTLHDAGATDRSFTRREDETARAVVAFGDGRRGARLPSGANNVRARYRVGLGAAGNVGAEALSQLLDRPLGLKGATNPLPASGGVDPEDIGAARASAPLAVRTLGRAVSLLDYGDFARAYAGVVKAHAAALNQHGGRSIVVTVALAGSDGIDTDRLTDLGVALRRHGDPHVHVVVVPYVHQVFRLALRVACAPEREAATVLAGVAGALGTAFSFDRREFGQSVHRSQIQAVAHEVPGVLAVDLDRLYRPPVPSLAHRLVAQRPSLGSGGQVLPAGLLVLADDPFDWLEAMP